MNEDFGSSARVFRQEIKELIGRASIEIAHSFEMYVVAVPVYKDSKICGHDDTPFFANKTP
jgi:hypothetical protein